MMNQPHDIHKLPDSSIRKIAAGEVAERPAHVIKELVENSLDSGATDITIEVAEGGLKLISVRDNGCGITPQNLPMSVACHSTSKLKDFTDLSTLLTMGFRGEALSAISAVSRFTIKSKVYDPDINGAELSIKNETSDPSPTIAPYHGPPGTLVVCEDLFFNVPARKQFMRRAQTEFSHIVEVIHAMALSCPHIKWNLRHNSKTVFSVEPQNKPSNKDDTKWSHLRKLTGSLFSLEDPSRLLFISSQNIYGSLSGLITPPEVHYPNQKKMFSFVNQRWIKDKMMNALINRGFHHHLHHKRRFPGCVLFFECEPSLIDVNIHPSKKEIKFQYQNEVSELIIHAIRSKLNPPDHPPLSTPPAPVTHTPSTPYIPPSSYESPSSSNPPPTISTSLHIPSTQVLSSGLKSQIRPAASKHPQASHITTDINSDSKLELKWNLPDPVRPSSPSPPAFESPQSKFELSSHIYNQHQICWSQLHYLGSFARLYWITEDSSDHRLIIVDQQAFHKRIILERLMNQPQNHLKKQPLTPPHTLRSSTQLSAAWITQNTALLSQLGFTCKHSQTAIAFETIPAVVVGCCPETLFERIIDVLSGSTQVHKNALLDVLASHIATPIGVAIDENTRCALFKEADGVDFNQHDSQHSRVFHILSAHEISRWFDRL